MVESVFRVAVIAIIIAIAIGVIGSVSFGWTLNTSQYLQGLGQILGIIYYILPIDQLAPIIWITFNLMAFRVGVAIIKTIWSIIPISG